MQAFGWRVSQQDAEERQKFIWKLPGICCRVLNLCAGVGCSCVTRADEEKKCFESSTGGRFMTYHLDGPEWVIRISEYPTAVAISIALDRPAVGREVDELYREISAAAPGRAMFSTSVSL